MSKYSDAFLDILRNRKRIHDTKETLSVFLRLVLYFKKKMVFHKFKKYRRDFMKTPEMFGDKVYNEETNHDARVGYCADCSRILINPGGV